MLPNNFLTTKEFRALSSEGRQFESQKLTQSFNPSQGFNIPNLTLVYNQGKVTKSFHI